MADRGARPAIVLLLLALVTACGDDDVVAPATSSPAATAGTTLVHDDEVVAVTADATVVRVDADGTRRGELGRVPFAFGAEVNAVDVSPDGTRVVVSVLNDHDEACDAHVYEFRAQAGRTVVAEGAAATFSPDGDRLLYLRYRKDGGFCPRSQVVVRSLADGTESHFPVPGGQRVDGTPGDWAVDWSPDSHRIVLVGPDGVLLSGLDGSDVTPLTAAAGADLRAFAPVFLDDDTVLAMTGCCVGAARLSFFALDGTGARPAFEVPTPVRSIRRDRGGDGVWLTLEERGLWRWDGSTVTQVAPDYLMSSG